MRIRDARGDAGDHAGIGAPGDLRCDFLGVELDGHVEFRAVVAAQLLPSLNSLLKSFAARNERPAFEIREGGFIRRDHAGARAAFDGHVADGHAPVHGKGANGFAAVFGDVAVAAGDARFPDDGKNQVLCRNASGAFSMHQNVERLGARLNETLRRKHMFDFAGADAESQRAERAVGRGMTVAADKGLAGLGDAEFRADDGRGGRRIHGNFSRGHRIAVWRRCRE